MTSPVWWDPEKYNLPAGTAFWDRSRTVGYGTVADIEGKRKELRDMARTTIHAAISAAYGSDSFESEIQRRMNLADHPSREARERLRPGDRRRYELRRRYHAIVHWANTCTNRDALLWLLMRHACKSDMQGLRRWFGGIDPILGDWWVPDGRPEVMPDHLAVELGPTSEEQVHHKEAELARYILGEHHDQAYRLAQIAPALTTEQSHQLRVLQRRGNALRADMPTHPHDLHDLDNWGYNNRLKKVLFAYRAKLTDSYSLESVPNFADGNPEFWIGAPGDNIALNIRVQLEDDKADYALLVKTDTGQSVIRSTELGTHSFRTAGLNSIWIYANSEMQHEQRLWKVNLSAKPAPSTDSSTDGGTT